MGKKAESNCYILVSHQEPVGQWAKLIPKIMQTMDLVLDAIEQCFCSTTVH
jgi:hypothetical protein